MFVRDTLTATEIPAFKNYSKKAKESHRHNTRHTSKGHSRNSPSYY